MSKWVNWGCLGSFYITCMQPQKGTTKGSSPCSHVVITFVELKYHQFINLSVNLCVLQSICFVPMQGVSMYLFVSVLEYGSCFTSAVAAFGKPWLSSMNIYIHPSNNSSFKLLSKILFIHSILSSRSPLWAQLHRNLQNGLCTNNHHKTVVTS